MIKPCSVLLSLSFIVFQLTSCNSKEKDESQLIQQTLSNSVRESNLALLSLASRNLMTVQKLHEYYGPVRVNHTYFQKEKQLRDFTDDACSRLKSCVTLNNLFPDSINSIKADYLKNVTSLDSSLERNFIEDYKNFRGNTLFLDSMTLSAEKAINDILVLESVVARFFENHLRIYPDNFIESSIIAGLNKATFKPGDTLELSIGIGQFTVQGNPEFEVNGEVFRPEPHGIGHHRIVVSKKGKNTLKVKVRFVTAAGKPMNEERTFHYNVD